METPNHRFTFITTLRKRRNRNRKRGFRKNKLRSRSLRRNMGNLTLNSNVPEGSFQSLKNHYTAFNRDRAFKDFNQTIDLSTDDGDSIITIYDTPSEQTKDTSNLINTQPMEVSGNPLNQNEIIDLTEASNKSLNTFSNQSNTMETTIIDLSKDDENGNKTTVQKENDEVLIVGTFSRYFGCSYNNNCGQYSPKNSKCVESTAFNPICGHQRKKLKNKINCRERVRKRSRRRKIKYQRITNAVMGESNFAGVGENVYSNSSEPLPSSGLRPIIIDGNNVAYVNSGRPFCCKRLNICIEYFKKKGHKVFAFVPQFRLKHGQCDSPGLLRSLERNGDVIFTPSKRVDGKNIVPYDDRFIVQTAVLKGGIIISRDNYKDLLLENPAWAETIKYRTLQFTWVDDVLMFPKDPLGVNGPTLETFLRFN